MCHLAQPKNERIRPGISTPEENLLVPCSASYWLIMANALSFVKLEGK